MRPDLAAALAHDFPSLLADLSIDVGDGWAPIVRRLAEQLEPLALRDSLRAFQVKEKAGGLRLYVNFLPVPDAVKRVIVDAQAEAAVTCEECGAPGQMRNLVGRAWTLCDPCEAREGAIRREQRRRWREGP